MVCISCIVIPFVLWVFHKFIQPFLKYYNPWGKVDQSKTEQGSGEANSSVQPGVIEGDSKKCIFAGQATNGDAHFEGKKEK